MIYLPDTNACIKYINRKNSPILHKFTTIPQQDVVLCDIEGLAIEDWEEAAAG